MLDVIVSCVHSVGSIIIHHVACGMKYKYLCVCTGSLWWVARTGRTCSWAACGRAVTLSPSMLVDTSSSTAWRPHSNPRRSSRSVWLASHAAPLQSFETIKVSLVYASCWPRSSLSLSSRSVWFMPHVDPIAACQCHQGQCTYWPHGSMLL